MSDFESIYMQKTTNEETDLLGSYAKDKNSNGILSNDNPSIYTESTKHTSIYDSISSKQPESQISSLFNTTNEKPSYQNEVKNDFIKSIDTEKNIYSNTDKMESIAHKEIHNSSLYDKINNIDNVTKQDSISNLYNKLNNEQNHKSGTIVEQEVKSSLYDKIDRESGVKFDSIHNKEASSTLYDKIDRESGVKFDSVHNKEASSTLYDKIDRESGPKFDSVHNKEASSTLYDKIDRESGVKFDSIHNKEASSTLYDKTDRESGPKFDSVHSGEKKSSLLDNSEITQNHKSGTINEQEVKSSLYDNSIIDSSIKINHSPDNYTSTLYHDPIGDPIELHVKPEYLNNDSFAHDLNVRGSRYGNMSITDKMRGVQANRLDIDGGEVSLAEMYNDSTLDNRVAGGRYNVTITDIYSDERKWRALHKLNTDGKIEVAENYQIDNDSVRAKEIKGGYTNESLKSGDINLENESLKISAQKAVEQKNMEDKPVEMYQKTNFDTLGKIQDFSFNKKEEKTNEYSGQLNFNTGDSVFLSGINKAESMPNIVTSSFVGDSINNESVFKTNNISTGTTNTNSFLGEDKSTKSIDTSISLYTSSILKNTSENKSNESEISFDKNLVLTINPDNLKEDTLIEKYTTAIDSLKEKYIVNKNNEIQENNNGLPNKINFSQISFNNKGETEIIQIETQNEQNPFNMDNSNFINSSNEIITFSMNEKIDSNIKSSEIIALGLVGGAITKKDNERENVKIGKKNILGNTYEASGSDFLFKNKQQGESFDSDKYVKERLEDKNKLSKYTLKELIELKNKLNNELEEEISEVRKETIKFQLKDISREMVKKAF